MMIDDNWELIQGEDAHAIEVLNYANQVNVIEALIRLLMHHHTEPSGSCAVAPNEITLREFHRTATLFLLHKPGEFRDNEVVVSTQDGQVIHTPPNFVEVEDRMAKFFSDLMAMWSTKSAQEIAAYCLWMVNWIHPFKNGNGRTARAFCYACLSLKLGFVLPGSTSVIDLIMQNRDGYQDALKIADDAYEKTGAPDLEVMTEFIDSLLYQQLSSIS